jgi:ComF family protein
MAVGMRSRKLLSFHLLRSGLGWLGQAGLDLLFPPLCIGCERIGFHLCPTCAQQVPPVLPPICECCGQPQAEPGPLCRSCRQSHERPLQMVRAAAIFAEPLRSAIHRLKYGSRPELGKVLARYLIAVFDQGEWQVLAPSLDAIVPVPLHRQRLAERGYNQSALLAEALGSAVGFPVHPGWLERSHATRAQVGLSPQERQENVAGAFRADVAVAGMRLLLVDDVFTTGATMSACALTALHAGAVAVYGLALAVPRATGETGQPRHLA